MDKIEYTELKSKIIAEHGKPEFDYDRQPLNEAARQLQKLTALNAQGYRKRKGLKDIANKIQTERYAKETHLAAFLTEKDLLPFTEKEQAIIIDRYEGGWNNKELAQRHGMSVQSVTALLNSSAVKMLNARVYDGILPLESLEALRKAMKGGDSKVALEIARHYKLIRSEELEITTNKPVDDPEAIKMLKALGDRLTKDDAKEG